MSDIDLNYLSNKEFVDYISQLSSGDLRNILPNLSLERLETVGNVLNRSQFLELLNHYPNDQLEEKIPPLLVGMEQEMFEDILLNASDKQLDVLKLEGFSEPVTHHLIVLIHRLEEDLSNLIQTLNALEARIDAIDPEITTPDDIFSIKQTLKECNETSEIVMNKINQTLAIAWSTGNIELIDQLNTQNSNLQRIKTDVIGSRNHNPSGLYALLAHKLYSDHLRDDDPALEGLAGFSVWYLEDYQDVGLIPSDALLSLDHDTHTDQECHDYRERLFHLAKDALNKVGLKTVKDLKEVGIFSRASLKEYVLHRNL